MLSTCIIIGKSNKDGEELKYSEFNRHIQSKGEKKSMDR